MYRFHDINFYLQKQLFKIIFRVFSILFSLPFVLLHILWGFDTFDKNIFL